jgi:hypothetical protein
MSACGLPRDRACASRPRLPAPRRPPHRRRARRRSCEVRPRHRMPAPSPGGADQAQARRARSSIAAPPRARQNPVAPKQAAGVASGAALALQQSRWRRHFVGLPRRTPHAKRRVRDRPATPHRPVYGRARRAQASARRSALRCVRYCRANSQARSCVRLSWRRFLHERGGHCWRSFEENQKLAYLFMICSNIKLTTPVESIGIEGFVFCKESQ